MNSKALLVLLLSIFYVFGAQWWYSNNIAPCRTEAAAVPAPVEKDPLMFNWSSAKTNTYPKFDAYKRNILAGDKKNNKFVITGKYFDGEAAPQGFANMGLARAAEIRKLFPEISEDRIEYLAEKVSMREGVKTNEFTNAAFSWKAAPPKVEETVVETANSAKIYFPFNSTQKELDTRIDTYLKKVSERLKKGSEKVVITGHTDDRGDVDRNYQLGLRRAKVVRDILIGYGVPSNKITTVSKGETAPDVPNGTEKNWRLNRRTVVEIVK